VLLVSDLPPWFFRVFAFAFGAIWGSFFNVAIYRWPRLMSVVTPPSHCPHCGTRVPAFRNVPIVSYIVMRGRAPCCGAQLTPRYVMVELMSGVAGLALAERMLVQAPAGTGLFEGVIVWGTLFAFVGGLIIATFVDLEWMEIPDEVTLPGAALGLATASLRPSPTLEEAALGAGGAYLVTQVVLVWAFERLTGRRGMGEGDSKLLLMVGAFLGWKGALFTLVAGAFQGIVASTIAHFRKAEMAPKPPLSDTWMGGPIAFPGGASVYAERARIMTGFEPSQLFVLDGQVEVSMNESTRELRIATLSATVLPSAGAKVDVVARTDGGTVVHTAEGAARVHVGGAVIVLAPHHALCAGFDGSVVGPVEPDTLALALARALPTPLQPDTLHAQAADLRTRTDAALGRAGSIVEAELRLVWERMEALTLVSADPATAEETASRRDAVRAALKAPPLVAPPTAPAKDEASESADFSKKPLPFGPFLALGAVEFLFFGEQLTAWYFALFD
jgi:leader peptidase (prepilin peptidase)/N-methyltransferase